MNQQSQDFVDTYIRENSPHAIYQEEDSGFKAWESEPVSTQNNTNLLRNLKSQLAVYQQKYRKLESNKTVPVKLPVLEYMRKKSHRHNGQPHPKHSQTNNVQNQCPTSQQQALTERKPSTSTKQPLGQHKSIQINTKKHTSYSSSRSIRKQTLKPSNNQQQSQKYMSINLEQQNNHLFVIPKVQQMKFAQNQQQKRLRKRDLYLAIFGDRGKGKVQRIEFDDQNKAYKQYLQRKNQQMKSSINSSHHANQKDNQRQNITIGNTTSTAINVNKETKNTRDTKNQELTKLRCSSQANTRYHINKPQINAKSIKIMSKHHSHLPIRF